MAEQPRLMVLTDDQINVLGTAPQYKSKHFDVLARSDMSFFGCHSYTFDLDEGGYYRHIPFSGNKMQGPIKPGDRYASIRKWDECTGFFPAFATHKAWFRFDDGVTVHTQRYVDLMVKQLGDYLDARWVESQDIIVVKAKNPTEYILEFDFGCHNFGPRVCVLAHKKQ